MLKIRVARAMAVWVVWAGCVVLLLGLAPSLCAASGNAAPVPFLPVVKSAADLPLRAEVMGDKADLLNAVDMDDSYVVGTLVAGSKVFILQKDEPYAQVVTAGGQSGWVARAALSEGTPASVQDYQRIVRAIGSPTEQAALNPAQQQLLQATFAAWFASRNWGVPDYAVAKEDAIKLELAALTLVRTRQLKLALSILLDQWERRVVFNQSASYDERDPYRLAAEPHFLQQEFFPRIPGALGAMDELDRLLCTRLREDQTYGITQYAFGGRVGVASVFYLQLIGQTHRDQPLGSCLVSALKKIAASNQVEHSGGYRVGDVELALELLATTLSKDQLERWVAGLAKQVSLAADRGNLGLALVVLKNVDAAPYVGRLFALAEGTAAAARDAGLAAQHMALWALVLRAPSQRVDALLRAVLLKPDNDMLLRTDALRILARKPLEPGLRETLAKVLRQPTTKKQGPSRVRQLAAETLATEALRPASTALLQTLMDDEDPYIRHVALQVVRNETLHAMKAARSVEERSRIRGSYLVSVRKLVEHRSVQPVDPLFKKSPLWMLKPQARLDIQMEADMFYNAPDGLPSVRIVPPQWSEPLEFPTNTLIPYPDIQPRVPQAYVVHPGKVLFKYGAVGRKNTVSFSLQLDELTADGQDIASRSMPAIYTVELQFPTGGPPDSPGFVWYFAWYCEPDDAFWSEAGFEGDGER